MSPLRIIAFIVFVLAWSDAFAGYPVSVTGIWTVILNQSTVSMRFFSQATSGICKKILGEMGNTNLEGFYCPGTGQITFARKGAVSNDTFQFFAGQLATDAAKDRMMGTFSDFPSLSEFGFYAVR